MPGSLIFPDWPAPARVRAAVTTRGLPGVSLATFAAFNLGANCGDDAQAVRANRAALKSLAELPSAPSWLRQVHGTAVQIFDTQVATNNDTPSADAAITRAPGVVLTILTADCLPLLVCVDDGSEIAAIHAGWRGMAAGVIECCIETLSAPRHRLMVWLGPAIAPASYEVGEEVRETFVAQDAATANAFVPTRMGRWSCDLYALARHRLAALGVTRVHGAGFDTFIDARFYSYRRDKTTGRFASLIWLAD